MTCPRCGRAQPPGEGLPGTDRVCVHCGRPLGGMRWVATTPDALRPRTPRPRPEPYRGPPAYRVRPRWSLAPWAGPPREPDEAPPPVGGTRRERAAARLERAVAAVMARLEPGDDPTAALRADATRLQRLTRWTAVSCGLAALAEAGRYVLLLVSRSAALPGPLLLTSDALVAVLGVLAPVVALVTGVVFLRWLLAARAVEAGISGTEPARSARAVVLGSVVPPLTLAVPGSVLCEIEHGASGRPAAQRPRPSVPVGRWWAAWAVGVVLGVVTVLHGFAGGTQALADGVELHALVDLVAAGTALLTARVVAHLTELLAPELRASGRSRVVRAAPVGVA